MFTVGVFPGQGSQAVGMLDALAGAFPSVRRTFEEASDVLHEDLWVLATHGPRERLDQTDYTQPVMLAAGVAAWRVWEEVGGCQPAAMAGHSLGEYTALVCAKALTFADGLRLVQMRARLMQSVVAEGVGAMAAVLGLDDMVVQTICAEVAQNQVVEAVNYNAPGQVVIAGHAEAVKRASRRALEVGARRVAKLAVSIPAHSSLMQPAAAQLAEMLSTIPLQTPVIPVWHNCDVTPHLKPQAIRDALVRQLYQPVRWVETIKVLADQGAGLMLELGPGRVLTGLIKRIDRTLKRIGVENPEALGQALKACAV